MADQVNPALEDIQKIADRPDLSPEEWDIVGKAHDWVVATARPAIRKELEAEYDEKYKQLEEDTKKATQEAVRESMEVWRKEQTPLSPEDFKTLLSQEYITFDIQVGKANKTFTIEELPARVEAKIVKSAEINLVPLMEKIAAADWSIDGNMAEDIKGILGVVPSTIEVAAEIVAIILNPRGDDKDVTKEWVLDNLSVSRMSYIIQAQSEANRYRDFFSNASRTFRLSKNRT